MRTTDSCKRHAPDPADLTITPRDRKFERDARPSALWHGGDRSDRHLQCAVGDLPGRRGLLRRKRARVSRRRAAQAGRGDQGLHHAGSDPQPRACRVQPPRGRCGLRPDEAGGSRSSGGWRSPGPSRRSSASRRPWRWSISPPSSRMSCLQGSAASRRRRPGGRRPVALACLRGDRAQGRRLRHLAPRDARTGRARKRWKVKAKVMLLVTRNFVVDRTRRRAGADAPGRRHRASAPGRGCFGTCGCGPGMFRKIAAPGSSSSCPASTRGTRTTASCSRDYRGERRATAAPAPAQEGPQRGLGGQRRRPPPASSASSSRSSRDGASTPRAQLSRGAVIPSRLEAELLEHPAGGRIVEEVRAFEPCEAERAGDVDQRRRRFGRKAAAPVGPRDPVAELDRARRASAKPAGADQPRRAVGPLEDQEATAAPDRAAARERPRRRAGGTATARSRGCGRSSRRQSLRRAPGRPRPSRASAAAVRSSRTFLPSPPAGPLAAAP